MRLRNIMVASLMTLAATGAGAQQGEADPFAYLEEIEGDKALAWARAENDKSLGTLQADPRYAKFQAEALAILQAKDRIPFVQMRSDGLYNFWQDDTHVRGLWRRTTMDSYRTANPTWETMLDIDALAKAEGANWVYQGANCLPPENRRCLVTLSDGGKDANTVREFDTTTKSFVDGGFRLPEAKQSVAWVDADTILVARDWGPGTLTKSGYPFVVKEMKRGQSLDQAREIFRGTADDTRADPFVLRDAAGTVHAVIVARSLNFFEREFTLVTPQGPVRLDIPRKSFPAGIIDGRLLLSLDQAWEHDGQTFKPDSLVSYDLAEWKRDPRAAKASLVWAPGDRQTLGGVSTTSDTLLLTTLNNVRG